MNRRMLYPLVPPAHLEAPSEDYACPMNALPCGAPFSPIHPTSLLRLRQPEPGAWAAPNKALGLPCHEC